MSTDREYDIDGALARLVKADRAAAPAVSDALMARILGDAAEVAGTRAAGAAAGDAARAARSPGARVVVVKSRRRMLRGWFGGALAAMSVSLTLGVGAGYAGVDPESVWEAGGTEEATYQQDTFGGEPF